MAGAAVGSTTVIGSTTAVSAASSSSYASISSFEIYAVRHIGHVVFRNTNHDTRHSAWKVWEQLRSFRIASASVGGGVVGFVAASSTVDVSDWARSAASGGAGAWRAERHIALWWLSARIIQARRCSLPFMFRRRSTIRDNECLFSLLKFAIYWLFGLSRHIRRIGKLLQAFPCLCSSKRWFLNLDSSRRQGLWTTSFSFYAKHTKTIHVALAHRPVPADAMELTKAQRPQRQIPESEMQTQSASYHFARLYCSIPSSPGSQMNRDSISPASRRDLTLQWGAVSR